MLRSGNPALRNDAFISTRAASGENAMTIQGTANKALILLGVAAIAFAWAWSRPSMGLTLLLPALILGFIASLVTIFKKEWAPVSAPIYAILEGVVLGAISMVFERSYPGIAKQAILLTFGVLFSLLAVYKSGLIKPTQNFKLGVFAATGGIGIFYLVSMIAGFFGVHFSILYGNGPLAIGFSVVVVIIAALNLVMDFDFIEQGAEQGAPKYMEWYGAFSLMVTLVWLYMEILRLLSKLQSRR
jgi:uncharacterized YccA/Bax inhibitor family protein